MTCVKCLPHVTYHSLVVSSICFVIRDHNMDYVIEKSVGY